MPPKDLIQLCKLNWRNQNIPSEAAIDGVNTLKGLGQVTINNILIVTFTIDYQ